MIFVKFLRRWTWFSFDGVCSQIEWANILHHIFMLTGGLATVTLWCLPLGPPVSGVILGPVAYKIEWRKAKKGAILWGLLRPLWAPTQSTPVYATCLCSWITIKCVAFNDSTQGDIKRVTLVYLYHGNRCGHHKKIVDCKVGLCTSLRTVAEFL